MSSTATKSSKGFTLLEAALVIAIVAVVGVGISNLLLNSVNVQMNERIQLNMEAISQRVTEALRDDMRFARTVAAPNATSLTITDNTGGTITYSFQTLAGRSTLTRTQNGVVRDFANNNPMLSATTAINCGGTCFSLDAATQNRSVLFANAFVQDVSPVNNSLDQAFSKGRLNIPATSFNIITSTRFN
jgi:type II secretory pathway pseudopilin PulG